MSQRVLFFSRDPGGANVIIPLVRGFQDQGYSVDLYGKDMALDRYRAAGLVGVDLTAEVKDAGYEELQRLLRGISPDLVITGTSANDFTEKHLWRAAGSLGIPSFAVLDQWLNYGIRFSNHGLDRISLYEQDKTHPYLPARILVMDETAREDMTRLGFEPGILEVVGHPYLEAVAGEKKRLDAAAGLRDRLGVGADDYLIVFAPEPISKVYNETDDSPHYWGYTERTILKEVVAGLERVCAQCGRKVRVVIRMHPQERPDNYDEIIREHGGRISLLMDSKSNVFELMLCSDLIMGMSSMFLLEAAALDRPIVSVLIGLARESPFILDRTGASPSIRSRDELESFLYKAIAYGQAPVVSLSGYQGAAARVINLAEGLLCRG
ncbi:MAG: hypothetical protein HPY50_12485 [Firmicutes bacterium]|nr:hypothetical protein [Bacillota bacterium]